MLLHNQKGAVCLFILVKLGKNRCGSHTPCVLSNISIVATSVDLHVAVNNPIPASQVGFQQFRAI